jgi:hypothetical protein
MTRTPRLPAPDWLPDFLFECLDDPDDPLAGRFSGRKAGPGEAVATRPSRGRPRKHTGRRAQLR